MTIRLKLAMAAIAVILVANSLLSLVGVRFAGKIWMREVQTRVRLNLGAAHAAYEHRVDEVARLLEGIALARLLPGAIASGDPEPVRPILDAAQARAGIDYIAFVDAQGRVVYRSGDPARRGDHLAENPLVRRALREASAEHGTLVLSREELAAEGGDLADRARTAISPTPAARPARDAERTDGLVIAAAVPVLAADGRLAGLLYGGMLLNRSTELVERIRREAFPTPSGGELPQGTVTIFLGDLRVATNVTTHAGQRAVGTRMSAAVYDRVLGHGETWADPAFVVDDWYLSAYEPIRDPDGRIIGALYVGLPQAPFLHTRNVATGVFLALVIGATAASLVLLFAVTMHTLRPIGRVVATARAIAGGDLSARVGMRPSGEMGALCHAIDRMADAVAEREDKLKLATRQQIGQSEKLASIGRLAAGVAHEINNPLTGVLTFAHLLREKPTMDEQDQQDLDLIIHETTRAADIVRSLLDFARERPARKEPLDVNECVRRTVRLIENQKAFDRIRIVEGLADDLPAVHGDINQLQQVLLNLSLNACEAMPAGGTLTVTTTVADGSVLVRLNDTGCGIRAEHLDKIFEPFFSTKPVGQGTGLGLSVTYGIVEQHGGQIEVESHEGVGTTFTIRLPALTPPSPDEVAAARAEH